MKTRIKRTCDLCNKIKPSHNSICPSCYLAIIKELGDDCVNQPWWNVFLRDPEKGVKYDRIFDNTCVYPITYDTVDNIILRLYRTYNLGQRTIAKILRDVYKIDISTRSVGYKINRLKKYIEPDHNWKMWRTWLYEVYRADNKQKHFKERKTRNTFTLTKNTVGSSCRRK